MRSIDAGETWAPFGQGIQPAHLFIHPTDPKIFLATTLGSQLFRSDDGGITYRQLSGPRAFELNGNCTLLAADAKNPGTFYVSQTNGNFGLWRTTDAGSTWTQISRSRPNVLAIDPADSNILVIPGQVSVDGGIAWEATSLPPGGISILVPDLSTLHGYYAVASGVFRSTDAGRTWTPVSDGLRNLQLTGVAMHPANPASLYAVSAASSDGFVAKLDPTGALVWSTLIGGAGTDTIQTLALGADNTIYVGGTTSSLDFPATQGTPAIGGYIARLEPDGTAFRFSTNYSGGSVATIALAPSGEIAVGGTIANQSPVNAAIGVLTPDASTLIDAKLINTPGSRTYSIAVNPAGRIAAVGYGAIPTSDITPNAAYPTTSGYSFLLLCDFMN